MALILRSLSPVPSSEEVDRTLEDAINSFKSVLTEEQRQELDRMKDVPPSDAVLKFTAQLDAKRQDKSGRCIASRIFTVLQSVRDFSSVVGTFVSSHPEIAALVWGSIRLTMLVVVNFTSYYEAISELFMNLGRISPRFERYQALFPNSKRIQRALCHFNASLIRMCEHIVTSLRRPWHAQLLRAMLESFQQQFGPDLDQIQALAKEVENEIDYARAQSEHRSQELQRLEQDKAEVSRSTLNRFFRRTENYFESTERWQIQHDTQAAREEKQKLLDFLSAHDYITPLRQARQKRYNNTANWFLQMTEFQSWLNDKASALLWCVGIIGSGKTILTSSVIDYLLEGHLRPRELLSFLFLRFDNAESLQAETILRAIAKQLTLLDDVSGDTLGYLKRMQSGSIATLKQIIEFIRLRLSILKNETLYIIIDALDECDESERKDVLDSLVCLVSNNECCIKVFIASREKPSSATRNSFPQFYQFSMGCTLAQNDIAEFVEKAVEESWANEDLAVTDKSLIPAIKAALLKHADGMFLWVRLQIREICSQRCDDDIRKAISDQRLPRTLEEIYNRILDRIISAGNDDTVKLILPWLITARRNLTLSELEDICCIHILQPIFKHDRRVNKIARIDSWCEGLVEIDEETKTVHLIHASVQKFLLGSPAKPAFAGFHRELDEADHYVGEMCVTYLSFEDFNAPLARRRKAGMPIVPRDISRTALKDDWSWIKPMHKLKARTKSETIDADDLLTRSQPNSGKSLKETLLLTHAFLKYALSYWLFHTENFEEEKSQTWELWKQMLVRGPRLAGAPVSDDHYAHVLQCLQNWSTNEAYYVLLNIVASSEEYMETMCRQDLGDAVKTRNYLSLKAHLSMKIVDVDSEHACYIAISRGDLKALALLFDANVKLHDIKLDAVYRCLERATIDENVEAVQFLLQKGIRHGIQWGNGSCVALRYAATAGNLEIMQVLIDAGFDVDACPTKVPMMLDKGSRERFFGDRSRGPAIYDAVVAGHIDAVKLLLEAGAEVNVEVEKISIFMLAILLHTYPSALIELLLTNGADINPRKPGDPGTPLQVAVRGGNSMLVERLLERGADANAPGSLTSGTALQEALRRRKENIICSLLDLGADVNTPASATSGTVLQETARRGDHDLVVLLLNHKADVNAPGSDASGTAFQEAVGSGSYDTVYALLSRGADINAPGMGSLGTALQVAARRGDYDMVEFLIDHGALVNAPGSKSSGTALQEAVSDGDYELVRFLLEKGADVNAPGMDLEGTALYRAIIRSDLTMIKLLLSTKKASVHSAGSGMQETALQAAVRTGNLDMVELLLVEGADAASQKILDGSASSSLRLALKDAAYYHPSNDQLARLLRDTLQLDPNKPLEPDRASSSS